MCHGASWCAMETRFQLLVCSHPSHRRNPTRSCTPRVRQSARRVFIRNNANRRARTSRARARRPTDDARRAARQQARALQRERRRRRVAPARVTLALVRSSSSVIVASFATSMRGGNDCTLLVVTRRGGDDCTLLVVTRRGGDDCTLLVVTRCDHPPSCPLARAPRPLPPDTCRSRPTPNPNVRRAETHRGTNLVTRSC